MKKFKLILSLLCFLLIGLLSGCIIKEETIPVNYTIPTMKLYSGNEISFDHQVGGNIITTSYNLGNYKFEDWRITDSKSITFSVSVKEEKSNAEILVEHVHADVVIKATNPQLNGLTQDSMDNSYHGTSQDGFLINSKYPYKNVFAIEGFSKDIIDGWSFYAGGFGSGSISSKRLTERTLFNEGVYGSEISVIYNFLVKSPKEDKYHIETIEDRFIIPSQALIQNTRENQNNTTNLYDETTTP